MFLNFAKSALKKSCNLPYNPKQERQPSNIQQAPVPAAKYVDIDPSLRAQRRKEWNRPLRWPAYALVLIGIVVIVPGVITFLRERQ